MDTVVAVQGREVQELTVEAKENCEGLAATAPVLLLPGNRIRGRGSWPNQQNKPAQVGFKSPLFALWLHSDFVANTV